MEFSMSDLRQHRAFKRGLCPERTLKEFQINICPWPLYAAKPSAATGQQNRNVRLMFDWLHGDIVKQGGQPTSMMQIPASMRSQCEPKSRSKLQPM
jgi:hypothetical protein